MLQRFNNAITNTKVALEMLLDEHDKKKEYKQNLSTEQRNLEDLIGNKGALKDEYVEQRRRFIGRFFLVGHIDIDAENKEYQSAMKLASFHEKYGEQKEFNAAMDLSDSLYDEIIAITQSRAESVAETIIANKNDNIGSYVVHQAASLNSLENNDAASSKTALALRDQLLEKGVNATLGKTIRSIMPFNDNHLHTMMSAVDGIQACKPEKSSFAAIAVVDPNEPKNPYIPTEYQRSIVKDLKDGGVVQLQSNPVYGKPQIWVPVY